MSEQVSTLTAPFWTHGGLTVADGRLQVAGRDAEALARTHGTPLYAFDLTRAQEKAVALRDALRRAGLDPRVRLAIKSCREPEVLAAFRALGPVGSPDAVGIDACSPQEVAWALAHGFAESEVSHTGTNMSDRDVAALVAHPDLRITVDLVTQVERLGRAAPGRSIGLRLNPRASASSRHEGGESPYSHSDRPTKFGILPEQLEQAVAAAHRHGMTVTVAHFHVAAFILNEQLPAFEIAVEKAAAMVARLQALGCPIEEVNAGGGLGVPLQPGVTPLDLDAYAGVLARHLGPLGVAVGVEPGEFLTDEAGLMLAEVVTVEERDGHTFAGLDAGWNVLCSPFVYGVRHEIVLTHDVTGHPSELVTVTGHINEGDDVFAEDAPLPPVAEGDVVAILGSGGYNIAMASRHCFRPLPRVVTFADRTGTDLGTATTPSWA